MSILDYLSIVPLGATSSQIGAALSRTRESVMSSLVELESRGKVKTVGKFQFKTRAVWVLCEPSAAAPPKKEPAPKKVKRTGPVIVLKTGAAENLARMQLLCRRRLMGEPETLEVES